MSGGPIRHREERSDEAISIIEVAAAAARPRDDKTFSIVAVAMAVLAAVTLAGCGGLLKRPEIRHYALTPVATPATRVAVSGLPIGIGGIELPPGLDRQEVVVRTSDQRLEVRGHELWAAPLETVVLHRLAFDLAARLPDGMVVLPGQAQPAGGLRSLDLAFEDLAAGPQNELVLDVRWTLRSGVAGAVELSGRERIVEPLPSLDSAEIAAATSRALATLADRIAVAPAAAPAAS